MSGDICVKNLHISCFTIYATFTSSRNGQRYWGQTERKKGNPKTPCLFIISFCRRCCWQGMLFLEWHCFYAELKCMLVVLLLDYGRRSWRSLGRGLGEFSPASFHLSTNSVFSWYSSSARKHLLTAPGSEVGLEVFLKRERIPHLLDEMLAASWRVLQVLRSLPATYEAYDRSFSALRNLSSTTLLFIFLFGGFVLWIRMQG